MSSSRPTGSSIWGRRAAKVEDALWPRARPRRSPAICTHTLASGWRGYSERGVMFKSGFSIKPDQCSGEGYPRSYLDVHQIVFRFFACYDSLSQQGGTTQMSTSFPELVRTPVRQSSTASIELAVVI